MEIFGGKCNSETTIIDMGVENVMYVKKIIFRILLYVILKVENIYQVLWMIQRLQVIKL